MEPEGKHTLCDSPVAAVIATQRLTKRCFPTRPQHLDVNNNSSSSSGEGMDQAPLCYKYLSH
jgi:hypothetical protein